MSHRKYYGWTGEGYSELTSQREYEEYTVMAVAKSENEYDPGRPVNLTLYVDSITGVVVYDLGMYEASL